LQPTWAGGYVLVDPAIHYFSPDRRSTSQNGLHLSFKDGVPIIPDHSPSRSISLSAKRAIDVVLTLAGLLVLWPFVLGIILAIKLTSRGPVLFIQKRVGAYGQEFDLYKFRSMYWHQCDTTGVTHTIDNDPRVTPLGRFLRRTSLDELPQLINVLRGDMSLVGPRPHVANMRAGNELYEEVVPYYGLRHAMRPGITGWAQVNGIRGEVHTTGNAKARIDHDLAYIQNFSVTLDVRILASTILAEFLTGTGN